jgi:hypothetical protein
MYTGGTRSQASSVGIATGYWSDDRGSIPGRGKTWICTASRPALGPTHSPIQWVPTAPSSGIKRQRREADHSFPSNTGQETVDLYIHFPIRLRGVVLNSLSTGTTLLFTLPVKNGGL